jgi:hypothetical protein
MAAYPASIGALRSSVHLWNITDIGDVHAEYQGARESDLGLRQAPCPYSGYSDCLNLEQVFLLQQTIDIEQSIGGISVWECLREECCAELAESRKVVGVNQVIGEMDNVLPRGATAFEGSLNVSINLFALGPEVTFPYQIAMYID